jgi:hypothetical protein
VEAILITKEEVSKIQLLEISQIELVDEEVRTAKMEIQFKTVKLEVGIEPLVAIQVKITKVIIEDTNV